MLGRLLDHNYPKQVRERITLLTVARLTANSAYRFAPPFLATIARDLDVSLGRLAFALSISELGGLVAPLIGRLVDHWPRRETIAGGLIGIAIASFAMSLSPNVAVFTLALLGIAMAKLVFDVAMTGWVAERVPFERRGRVISITELSWAGGLLIGVPVMGLVTWATSWHVAYVVAGIAVIILAGAVAKLLEPGVHRHAGVGTGLDAGIPIPPLLPPSGRRLPWARIVPLMAANLCLMLAAQAAFVTFGSWLEDDFGFSAAALAAVAFGLGTGELIASSSSVRFTDAWGKRRSMICGAALMVPSGLLLAVAHSHVAVGLVCLAVYILGFEFAIISGLPLSSNLIPGRPSTGIGIVMVAGTTGRAAMSVPAARLYERHGLVAPLLVGTGCAALCLLFAQFVDEPVTTATRSGHPGRVDRPG